MTGNGFGYMNQIIKDGRRNSMARAFLYPVLGQKNVTVLVNTQVNRVVLKGDRAVGVECVRDGKLVSFRAHDEVILSAGGFNTPKLLMLSGIGDETRPARGQHPGTGARAGGRQERAGPHPARRLPVRGARAVRVPQQRRQRVGLLQDRRQARTTRREPRADRAAVRERRHRRAVQATAHHVGSVRRPGDTEEPRHGAAPVRRPDRPADRGHAVPESSRTTSPRWSGASRSPGRSRRRPR